MIKILGDSYFESINPTILAIEIVDDGDGRSVIWEKDKICTVYGKDSAEVKARAEIILKALTGK